MAKQPEDRLGERLKVVLVRERKAHLFLDGLLCQAGDAVGSFAPFSAWYQVRPRMRCRRCSLRWERLKHMLESFAQAHHPE